MIGGTSAGEGNLIAGNTGPGVRLYEGESGSADANRILGTSIHSNGGLGIDLTTDADPSGVTPNDAGDGDSGPNNLQNFLVIDTAETTGSQIHITGTLNSTPSTLGYRVEYFHSAACDGTNGEGEVFIGSQTANTDAGGAGGVDGTFVVAVPAGRVITATVTDPAGNTSEFSACKVATAAPGGAQTFTVNTTAFGADGDGCSAVDCTILEAITAANATPDTDTIDFAIPGEAPFVIETPGTLSVTEPVVIDATTQPGYSGTPLVALDGQSDNRSGSRSLRATARSAGSRCTRSAGPPSRS